MDTPTPLVITDIRIPFFRLVLFLVKLSLAAIPAAIVLAHRPVRRAYGFHAEGDGLIV